MTLDEALKHPAALEDFLVEKYGRVLVFGAHYSEYAKAMYVARKLAKMLSLDVDAVIESAKAIYNQRKEKRS